MRFDREKEAWGQDALHAWCKCNHDNNVVVHELLSDRAHPVFLRVMSRMISQSLTLSFRSFYNDRPELGVI